MSYQTQTPRKLREAAAAGLACPPEMSVSQWADENAWLSAEDSAEPGKYLASRAEYQRGIMDACSDPEIQDVAFKASSQVGKTQIVKNVLAYHMDYAPCPAMMMQPTLEMAEAFSKERLAPMLRDTPCLRGKVKDPRSRDSGNTLRSKKYPGGFLALVGANSPASLASRPIRLLLCDEVDRYDQSAGTEGDPLNLAKARTKNFWNAKRIYISSPGIAGLSRIDQLWELSDKRRFFVSCPQCAHEQFLVWEQLKYTEGPPRVSESGDTVRQAVDAWYECEACSLRIDSIDLAVAVSEGAWRATAPLTGIAGFHIWEAYSPWSSLLKIANSWLEAQGKPEQIKTFKNTVTGETYQQSGEAPDWERVKSRAEDYPAGTAPSGVLFVSAGVDVQKDRIVVDFWGWGRGKQRWRIDREVLVGDVFRPDVWASLTVAVNRTFTHAHGVEIPVLISAIDSGFATGEVYNWAKQQGPSRVIVVKGYDSGVALLGQPAAAEVARSGKQVKVGVRVWPVNVSMAKSELYGYLNQSKPEPGEPAPPGWIHTPTETEDEWYRELCAEQFVTRVVKGFRRGEWVKIRERNEALDTANYARAAAAHVGIDRFSESHWSAWESAVAPYSSPPAPEAAVTPQPASRAVIPARRVNRGSFL